MPPTMTNAEATADILRFYSIDAIPPVDTYVYKLVSTRASSEKYGPCDICGKHVTEVWHQMEGQVYICADRHQPAVTHYQCKNYFGHKDCLTGKQR